MKKLLLLTAIALASGGANAASISFSDSYGLATTNWTQNLNLQQFDSSLGTLTSIVYNYSGDVDSAIRFESLDAAASTITATSAASIVFGVPVSQTLNISSTQTFNATAFDGSIDFGGTSGNTYPSIIGSDSGVTTLLSGFAPYIGLGTYAINVAATGTSAATGAGNLIQQVSTQGRATIQVTYNYDVPTPPPHVPEPATLALMGMGLAGFAAARRKKQA